MGDWVIIVLCVVIAAVLSSLITRLVLNAKIKRQREALRAERTAIKASIDAQKSFVANMSHEIRTPINTVIGMNELNLRSELDEDTRANSINIESASKILLGVVNDILDFSKIESGKLNIVEEKYEAISLINDVVEMNSQKIKDKGLEFMLDIPEDIPTVMLGDELRIKQVLLNVLSNAVKYTEKGWVRFRIRGEKSGDDDIRLTIQIADSGKGMKPESIAHLFDAYSRFDETKNHFIEGTGLGMAITKQLLDLMGGEISVDSIYGNGSRFTVVIPQKIVDPTPMGEATKAIKRRNEVRHIYEQKFIAPKARLLIVDDNALNRLTATKLLEQTKLNIDATSSGKEALELTRKNVYHIILMDHLMPEMDGIETLNRIRQQADGLCREAPVIALTANAGSEMEELYRENGFQDYIVKPINSKILESTIMKFLPKSLVTVTGSADAGEDEVGVAYSVKRAVTVTVDGFCDLSDDLLGKYNIQRIPTYVHTPRGRFIDGEEIISENISAFYDDNEAMLRSEPPSVDDYLRFFAINLVNSNSIIHISVSSRESEAYSNAVRAAKGFSNVYVVDSLHLSLGQGLMAILTARYVMNGTPLKSILQMLPDISKRIHSSFILAQTDKLMISGRLSPLLHRLCGAFRLKPILFMKNGRITLGSIFTGNSESVYRRYIRGIIGGIWDTDPEFLFITYVSVPAKTRSEISGFISRYINSAHIIELQASSAIGINVGSGTVGIFYLKD